MFEREVLHFTEWDSNRESIRMVSNSAIRCSPVILLAPLVFTCFLQCLLNKPIALSTGVTTIFSCERQTSSFNFLYQSFLPFSIIGPQKCQSILQVSFSAVIFVVMLYALNIQMSHNTAVSLVSVSTSPDLYFQQ